MSLKKIRQIKSSKWLSIWDLIAFGAIVVIAVVLILVFTLGKDKSEMEGFYAAYGGERVFVYDFDRGEAALINEENITIEEGEGGFTVRFTTDGGKGFNVIFVDTKNRTVNVVDSNCSSHKDCVHTPKLKNNSSSPIICTPHSLTIAPLKFVDDGKLTN